MFNKDMDYNEVFKILKDTGLFKIDKVAIFKYAYFSIKPDEKYFLTLVGGGTSSQHFKLITWRDNHTSTVYTLEEILIKVSDDCASAILFNIDLFTEIERLCVPW